MSLREVSARARMQGIAEVSDIALLKRLRLRLGLVWHIGGPGAVNRRRG